MYFFQKKIKLVYDPYISKEDVHERRKIYVRNIPEIQIFLGASGEKIFSICSEYDLLTESLMCETRNIIDLTPIKY